jgi:hypothetical protein
MSRRRLPANVRAVVASLRAAGYAPQVVNGVGRGFIVVWRDCSGRRRRTLSVSAPDSNRQAVIRSARDITRVGLPLEVR